MSLNYIAVGIGGAIGALLRYIVSVTFSSVASPFPLGTVVVNLVGSFLLGFLTTRWFVSRAMPSFLVVGVGTGMIGSFTTFSTFSVEFIELMKNGLFFYAFLYSSISLLGGILLAYYGYRWGKRRKAV